MSKVSYIVKVSDSKVSENAALVLIEVAKTNFIVSSDIRDALEEKLSPSSVNSNIGVLIKKGLIEKTGDGLIISSEGQDLINEAAALYAKENKPELLKERRTRKPRGTTEEMEKTIEFIKELIKDDHEIKEVEINRSNMGVVLAKRLPSGVRKLEVMRKGVFRIFGYKVSQETLDKFENIGMSYRVSKNGSAYIDMPNATEDFIESAIKLI